MGAWAGDLPFVECAISWLRTSIDGNLAAMQRRGDTGRTGHV